MHRFFRILGAVALIAAPVSAPAQSDQTLADIRQELSVLYVDMQRLRRELSTTGAASGTQAGGSLLDRVAAIEAEMQRLTAKTEELEFRIDSVVKDGTNRIDDIEFRLCEMDSNCNIETWAPGKTLGGGERPSGGTTPVIDTTTAIDGPQLAVGEQADFDAAVAALEAGEYASAAQQFASFQQNYPGGPMTTRAQMLQGLSLESNGQISDAARVYLDTFSLDPNGPVAPEALLRLGVMLGQLNKVSQACVTLGEVEARFPAAEVVPEARSEMAALACQ